MSEWRNSDMWIEHKDHAPIAPAASTGAARAVVKVHNAEIDAKDRELDASREREKALREAVLEANKDDISYEYDGKRHTVTMPDRCWEKILEAATGPHTEGTNERTD